MDFNNEQFIELHACGKQIYKNNKDEISLSDSLTQI